MVISSLRPVDDSVVRGSVTSSPTSAVSWGAVFAGATGAAALSLILLILGTGLGLSSVSPWAHAGASATTLGVATIVWVIVTQLLASGMGGYLAGRLRSKWTDVHTDEVFFRDTAHGFLAWGVASLATAALLGSVIGNVLGGGVQAGATVAGQAATAAVGATAAAAATEETTAQATGAPSSSVDYFVDTLFRKNMTAAPTVAVDPASNASLAEVSRIFVNGLRAGALPQDDARYVGMVVAQRTGLSQVEAEKRVNDTFASALSKLRETQATAKAAADKARKASAHTALWLFVSLLVGAFIASYAATFGGRLRDA